MRKRSLLFCALLLAFWLVVSGEVDPQHLLAGAVLAILTVWFWQDLGPRLPRLLSGGELLLLGHGAGSCQRRNGAAGRVQIILLLWARVNTS
jgi:hypothetical protein